VSCRENIDQGEEKSVTTNTAPLTFFIRVVFSFARVCVG
jgi:hypothetical protein